MLRSMIKGAVAFFVIGMVVGTMMPLIAGGLGAAELVTAAGLKLALFEGATFGIFGFLAPPFQQLCNTVFGDPEKKAVMKENTELKIKLNELDQREQLLEQTVTPRHVQQIISAGKPGYAEKLVTERSMATGSPTPN